MLRNFQAADQKIWTFLNLLIRITAVGMLKEWLRVKKSLLAKDSWLEGNLQYCCYKVLHKTMSWFWWIRNQTTPLFTAQAITTTSIDANKLCEVQTPHLCGPEGFIQEWLWLESHHGLLSSHSHLHSSLWASWLQSSSFPLVQDHDPLLTVLVQRHCVVVSPEHLSRRSIIVGYTFFSFSKGHVGVYWFRYPRLSLSLTRETGPSREVFWKKACGRSSVLHIQKQTSTLWLSPN